MTTEKLREMLAKKERSSNPDLPEKGEKKDFQENPQEETLKTQDVQEESRKAKTPPEFEKQVPKIMANKPGYTAVMEVIDVALKHPELGGTKLIGAVSNMLGGLYGIDPRGVINDLELLDHAKKVFMKP